MTSDQEFLETVATVIAGIKEMAHEIGIDDRLVLSCFVGIIDDHSETNKLNAVYDFVFENDDEFDEVTDFMVQAWEENKDNPPNGTIDWWIDRLN